MLESHHDKTSEIGFRVDETDIFMKFEFSRATTILCGTQK